MIDFKKRLRTLFSHVFHAIPVKVTLGLLAKMAPFINDELKSELSTALSAEPPRGMGNALRAPDQMAADAINIGRALPDAATQLLIEKSVLGFLTKITTAAEKTKQNRLQNDVIAELSDEWRREVRSLAGLQPNPEDTAPKLEDIAAETEFLIAHQHSFAPVFKRLKARRVLYAGQCYYYSWYLSRALRKLGWRADVFNWDPNPASQIFYHGQDFQIGAPGLVSEAELLDFYVQAIYSYDVVHFSNSHGICFGDSLQNWFRSRFEEHAEIYLLKVFGKAIVYTNNGCLDGVSQTAFSQWGPLNVCSICRWQNIPAVCSDERNLIWGVFRNAVADFQCLLGGNRVDFNTDPRVHEVPAAYCLEPEIWAPNLEIPARLRLPSAAAKLVRVYHAVGNKEERTRADGVNIKCTHIYLPLIEKLQREGVEIELISPDGVPNLDVRFLQMQSDIILEMLTYGWFGTNVREGLMLGKPVICYIRPEWLESLRAEIPEYAEELPIVSATPETVEEILRELIANPAKRQELGRRGREFALKWHSTAVAGRRFDDIYGRLIDGRGIPS